MVRTIVYRRRKWAPEAEASGDSGERPDTYVGKLIKYVPAESIGFFIALAHVLDSRAIVVLLLAAGAVLTPAYLRQKVRKYVPEDRPLPHYFVLMSVSFVGWAVGTSPEVADMVGLSRTPATIVLGLVAFMLPAVDFLCEEWLY